MYRQEFEDYVAQGGKLFVVTDDIDDSADEAGWVKNGEIVELKNDDGSVSPAFYYPNKEKREKCHPEDDWRFISLGDLAPYTLVNNNIHYDPLHQPIETMQANMTPEAFRGYLRGNIIKYTCRMGRKDGEAELKEAKKIQDYAKWLVESLEGKTINPREEGK